MKAVEHNHAVPPEELMAYLDGELEPERALVVHAHLANCGSCEALAAELRHTSSDMALWEVPAPVQSLQPPASPVGTASKRLLALCVAVGRRLPSSSPEPRRWLSSCAGLWLAIGGGRYARTTVPEAVARHVIRRQTRDWDSCAARWPVRIGHRRRTGAVAAEAAAADVEAQPTRPEQQRRVLPRLAPRRSSAP